MDSDSGRRGRNFEEHERENVNCLTQTVSRDVGVEDAAGEGSKGSEENIIGNLEKWGPC